MQKLTQAQIADLVSTCSASTDGGNFVVCQGKHYYSIDAYTMNDGTTVFTVDHWEVTGQDDWAFYFDGNSKLDQFTFVEAWSFDDAVEASLHYGKLITGRALAQMRTGI